MRQVTFALLLLSGCTPDPDVSTGSDSSTTTTTPAETTPTSSGGECTHGTEGCPCIDGALCVSGLVCLSSLCVDAAGTTADSSTQDSGSEPTSDTGTSDGNQDHDGDGFAVGQDCDDNDQSVFPLVEHAVNVIDSDSTIYTICPGTYHSSLVDISGLGITINADGVLIDMDGALRTAETARGVLEITNSHQVAVHGIQIRNFGDWFYGVRVESSSDITLTYLSFYDVFSAGGGFFGPASHSVFTKSSPDITIDNCDFSGAGVGILLLQADNAYIGNTKIYSDIKGGAFLSAEGIVVEESPDSLLENLIMDGSSIALTAGSAGSTIRNSQIFNGKIGVEMISSGLSVKDNTIWGVDLGITIYASDSTVIGNTITAAESCLTFTNNDIMNSMFEGNTCN